MPGNSEHRLKGKKYDITPYVFTRAQENTANLYHDMSMKE